MIYAELEIAGPGQSCSLTASSAALCTGEERHYLPWQELREQTYRIVRAMPKVRAAAAKASTADLTRCIGNFFSRAR